MSSTTDILPARGSPVPERNRFDLRTSESLVNRESKVAVAGVGLNRPLWFYLIVLAWLFAAIATPQTSGQLLREADCDYAGS